MLCARRPQALPLFRLVSDHLRRLQTIYGERFAREYGPWRLVVAQVAGYLARASSQSPRSRMQILVIEDHTADLKLADLVLSTAGHDVSTAESAEQAFAVIQEDRPQLILLDLDLPGMDGLALVRQLKADPNMRNIDVVAVARYLEQYPPAAGRRPGCRVRCLPAKAEQHP